MNPVRKYLKNKKGINTILAALLMVVIVVVASVMVYAWSTGLLGTLLVQPNVGKEALNMDSNSFATNNTVVSIFIRNSGSASVTLQSYYVKDANGNSYQMGTWSGPTITVNSVVQTNFQIGASCSGCVTTGSGFTTFQTGNAYTVIAVTSRNNQFTFSVTR